MRKFIGAACTAGVAASLLVAAPAQASQAGAPEGQYVINDSTGASFALLNSNNLLVVSIRVVCDGRPWLIRAWRRR